VPARRGGFTRDLAVAFPAWFGTRAVTLGALALARYVVDHGYATKPGAAFRVHQGFFAWDAAFYRQIAAHGYHGVEALGLRFFPLVPLMARFLGFGLGGRYGLALILIVNASALVMGALLHRLVIEDLGDANLARRSAWLVALVPPAYVLALGYAEATFMALAIGAFIGLRTRKWGVAIACGVLAGLTRPIGALLVLPAAVEAWRGWAGSRGRERVARVTAVLAPAAGVGLFLGWSAIAYHDLFRPLRAQSDPKLRGRVVSPITALLHEGRGILHGTHIGSGLHVPWALALIVLLVVCARRLPASYSLFAASALVVGLSTTNLESFERYCLSAFPFVVGGATLTASDRVEKLVLALGAAGMAGYAILAFLNATVP
jgi:hypothetical protein